MMQFYERVTMILKRYVEYFLEVLEIIDEKFVSFMIP